MNTSPSLSPPGSDLDGLVEFIATQVCCPRVHGCELHCYPDQCPAERVRTALLSERALRERVEGERDEAKEDKRIAHAVRDEMAKLAGQQRRRAEASEARSSQLEAELKRRDAVAAEAWGDQADEHTPAIEAAHPTRTEDHDTFAKALAMVGKRRGKYELVGLVNWLLAELKRRDEALRGAVEHLHGLTIWPAAEDVQKHYSRTNWQAGYDSATNDAAKEAAALLPTLCAALQPQEGGDA